jgi:hypothetical protein
MFFVLCLLGVRPPLMVDGCPAKMSQLCCLFERFGFAFCFLGNVLFRFCSLVFWFIGLQWLSVGGHTWVLQSTHVLIARLSFGTTNVLFTRVCLLTERWFTIVAAKVVGFTWIRISSGRLLLIV